MKGKRYTDIFNHVGVSGAFKRGTAAMRKHYAIIRTNIAVTIYLTLILKAQK